MAAATATQWLTAASVGVGAYLPIALAVLNADRDFHLPRPSLDPARTVAERAAQRARLQAAAWLLVLAWHLETGEATR